MSRIFLSHASADELEAIAVKRWLEVQGWSDVFLDTDPERGLKPGERWQAALRQAADRCEAVVFLISPAWSQSKWCLAEFLVALSLNKLIFGVILKATPISELPSEMTSEWQLCPLIGDGPIETVNFRYRDREESVPFLSEGLRRLKVGLTNAGLGASFFHWPPDGEPERSPYRGLEPMDGRDAAVFFGRDTEILRGLDVLRSMRNNASAATFVVLGASGTGKSSFLRAGLLPRLAREDWHFHVLPVVRPELAPISGTESGLAQALHKSIAQFAGNRPMNLADVRSRLQSGDVAWFDAQLVQLRLAAAERLRAGANGAAVPAPTLVIAVDQAEELFSRDATAEAETFLHLLGSVLRGAAGKQLSPSIRLPVLVAFTTRSDRYEPLQTARALEGVQSIVFDDLRPMPRSRFAEVIRGPATRSRINGRPLEVKADLVDCLVEDCVEGGDTLPLLSLTLSRLYRDYGSDGDLRLDEYEQMGGMATVVKTEAESILARQDALRTAQLKTLREAFIPWLATINPDNDQPIRRMAHLSDLPAECHALIDAMAERRLLLKDRRGGVVLIEVAHEALLRRWDLLANWLREERDDLKNADALLRANGGWASSARNPSWLLEGDRLVTAEQLFARPGFHERLRECSEFLQASRARETARQEEHERMQRAELAAARQLAAEQSARADAEAQATVRAVASEERIRKRSRALWAALVTAAIALSLTALLAVSLREQTRVAKTIAKEFTAVAVVGRSLRMLTGEMDGGTERAYQQLLAAYRLTGAPEAASAFLTALSDEPALLKVADVFVSSIAYSPDGKLIVTAGPDGTVRRWDAVSLQAVGTPLGGHSGRANAADFSPDGTSIASGGEDGTIRLWDVKSSRQIGEPLSGHSGGVERVAFSRDGAWLAAGGGTTVRVWSAASRRAALPPLEVRSGYGVLDVKLNQNGSRVVALAGGTLTMWDTRSGKVVAEAPARQGGRIGVLADGSGFVVASTTSLFDLLDPNDLKRMASVGDATGQHADDLSDTFVVTPDGKSILASTFSGSIATISIKTGLVLLQPGRGDRLVGQIAVNPADSTYATLGSDLRLWKGSLKSTIATPLFGHQKAVRALAVSRDGGQVASGGEDGLIRLWNGRTGEAIGSPLQSHRAALSSLTFAPDAPLLLSADDSGTLLLWNVQTRQLVGQPDCRLSKGTTQVAFSPKGHQFAASDGEGKVCFYDVASGKVLREPVQGHARGVTAIAFSPDGTKLVSSGREPAVRTFGGASTVRIWDTATGTAAGERLAMNVPNVQTRVGFSPDGSRIFAISSIGVIRAWEVSSGSPMARGMQGDWSTLTLSSDRRNGATVDTVGRTMRFWDVETQLPIGPPLPLPSGASIDFVGGAIAYSPDDSFAVVAGGGTATPWLFPAPKSWPQELCARLTRNMSRQQWNDWFSADIEYVVQCPGLPEATDEQASAAPASSPASGAR